jgi:hypothetical protein
MIDDDAYERQRREIVAADPFYREMERVIGEDEHLVSRLHDSKKNLNPSWHAASIQHDDGKTRGRSTEGGACSDRG